MAWLKCPRGRTCWGDAPDVVAAACRLVSAPEIGSLDVLSTSDDIAKECLDDSFAHVLRHAGSLAAAARTGVQGMAMSRRMRARTAVTVTVMVHGVRATDDSNGRLLGAIERETVEVSRHAEV